jgi:hypothetical protein
MNAYEIERIEQQMKAEFRLPLAYESWADIERRAHRERAHMMGKAFAHFFSVALSKITGIGSLIRSTAAQCTGARLRHDH